MYKIKKADFFRGVFYFLFLFVVSICFSFDVYALEEDFVQNFSNPTKWALHDNSHTFEFLTEGNVDYISFNAPSGHFFPYLHTRNLEETVSSVSVRFRVKAKPVNFGAGILVLASDLAQNGSPLLAPDTQFLKIWAGGGRKFKFFTTLCDDSGSPCNPNTASFRKIYEVDCANEWHEVDFKYNGNSYQVYYDGSVIFTSAPTAKVANDLWLGHPEHTNTSVDWPGFDIDYVYINEEGVERDPIVLIPGHGASWDYSALLTGTGGSNWQVPSFIHVYDNLIASLEAAGYTEGEDLFLFNYDWRKSLVELDDDLASFIENLQNTGKIEGDESIDLVGHSYGGLVGRSYLHEQGDGRIDQLITAGSPHKGSALAYGAWEGGAMWNKPWWQKAAIEILLKLNRQPGESKVEALQRMVPSVKDLLPIYSYLFDLEVVGGQLKDNEDLIERNQVLGDFDSMTDQIASKSSAIAGDSGEEEGTLDTIDVEDRSWLDEGLNKWVDGKPVGFNKTSGDGTVTIESGEGDFSKTKQVGGDHLDIVSDELGIGGILNSLNLSNDAIKTDSLVNKSEEVMVALLRSPGEILITNPNNEKLGVSVSGFDGFYIADEKIAIIPSPIGGNYQIDVIENGEEGEYELYLGMLKNENSKWLSYSGTLDQGDTDSYQTVVGEGDFEANENDGYEYSEVVNELFAKVEELLADWNDRKGYRAKKYYEAAKRHVQDGQTAGSDQQRGTYLLRSRFLLNNLERQARNNEKWQLKEAIEEVLYKLQDWGLNSTQSTNSDKVLRLKTAIERLLANKESKLQTSANKYQLRSFEKIGELKTKADGMVEKGAWGKAQEMYMSIWFWLMKV